MQLLRKLKEVLSASEATNWMLVAGFILTIGANYWIDVVKSERAERQASVVELRSASSDVQTFAFLFVSALTAQSALIEEEREQLARQLIILNDLVDDPRMQLDAKQHSAADQLQQAIVDLQNAVLETDKPEDLTDFWVALRDVLVKRNTFLEELGQRDANSART